MPEAGPANDQGKDAARPAVTFRPLESKLSPPRPLLPLIPRPALRQRLLAARAPLVVVAAPAGAGKTSLLLQWGEADGRLVSWLTVDEADNDPVTLLHYLAAALARVADVDPEVDHLLELAAPPIDERVLPLLAAAVAAAPPFVLIVDDAHLVTNERCWRVLGVVLANLPSGTQLALGTRVDPPLSLGRLRAEGRLVQLGMDELSFDRAEAAELWAGQNLVADDGLDAVLAATEGWATGLYLASLIAGGTSPEDWLRHVRGDQRDIAAYLTREVLQQAPADVRRFLYQTAILDELTVPACRELTGRDDAGDVLLDLARGHLFLSSLDETGQTYRYHPLFAELLRAEFGRREPAAFRESHAAAARHYLASSDLDAAFRHQLAAGDVAAAAAIATRYWPELWDRGNTETVRRWLASFDDRDILADPALTLTAGWVYSALADSAEGKRWTAAACSARVDDTPAPFGAASLASAQALLCATVAPDGVTTMRACAEEAARLEARPGTSWYADARFVLGTAHWLAGAPRQAIRPLQIAAREGAAFNPSAQLAALGSLSLIAADADDWPAAADYAEQAAARLAELGFGTYRRSLPVLLAQARVAAHMGCDGVPRLVQRATNALEMMVAHPWMTVVAGVLLGEISLECGDLVAAHDWCRRAGAALRRYPDAGTFAGRADRLRQRLELERLVEPLTRAEHALLELLPTHLTEAQLAERLFVSPNTVKTHLHAIYRKLGVKSRSQAVERARELALLRHE